MRYLAGLICGFLLAFLSHTLFGSVSFYALAAAYAFVLYLLFFLPAEHVAAYALAGLTLASELLGTARLGRAAFLGAFILLLAYLFKERLRFTSPFLRYIVCLALLLICYGFWLFPWSGFAHRLALLAWTYPALLLCSSLLYSFRRRTTHEFI